MIILLGLPSVSYAQNEADSLRVLKNKALRVFLDCVGCDLNFIRAEITYLNYVRERKEAQVHILVTTQSTGAGGREYTVTFIGQQDFSGIDDTLKFITKPSETEEYTRSQLVRILKMGLMRYVNKTPMAEQISISYNLPAKPTTVTDKWNSWVFNLNVNTYLSGQKFTNFASIYGSLSANRVTQDLKIKLSFYGNYDESNFTIEDSTGDITISSFSRGKGFESFIVISLNEHWSAGVGGSWYSSTFSNTKLSIRPKAGLEYNFFPYSASTRKQLRIQYIPTYNYIEYYEETIFDKNLERLFSEILSVTLELKEPWGSISTTLEGSHYFHDFNRNRLELFGNLSLRIIKGVSLQVYGSYSRIRDQLSLPKRGATQQEILLQRRQLATQYQYYTSIGLSYSFGSIYSNIVNLRFGN